MDRGHSRGKASGAISVKGPPGFTLIEILCVVAILAIASAIVSPVVLNAKRHSQEVVAISNLRQAGIALIIYSEDYGGIEFMPARPAADEALAKAPTCDPRDNFRVSCNVSSPKPMIGSFAYPKDDWLFADDASWRTYLSIFEQSNRNPILLLDLFSSHKKHRPGMWFGGYSGNPIPDQVRVFESDGSVRLRRPWSVPTVGYTWASLFLLNK